MRRLGFASGDTLAIQMANSPGYIVVILAAWYLGVTCAGIIPFSVSSEYHPGGREGGGHTAGNVPLDRVSFLSFQPWHRVSCMSFQN